jgi:hypothetical protein
MKKKQAKSEKIGKKMVFCVNLKPYNQECIVLVNAHINDALKFLKKHDTENAKKVVKHIEEDMSSYTEGHSKNGGILYHKLPHGFIMSFNHGDSWVQTVGTVVHEATHLVHYAFRRAGITLTEESEEAYTYLIQETVEQILYKIY